MTRRTQSTWAAMALAVLLLAGCQTDSRTQVLATTESQLALRQMQSRAFDTTDRNMMLRTVVATLQDLSFVIDEADAMIGSVSGTKLDGYRLRMTVSIRPRGETQLLVRANAQYNVKAVDDPEPYQQFFFALEKSLFLTAHQVD
jgi:outer membrane murein-binding lipoprotein Lpp